MKAAIISPTPLLEKYATLSDNYHLVLSDVARRDSTYLQFYRKCSDRGDFVILDNSAHELGVGDMNHDFFDIARDIRASEIALPDRLFFGDDTVELSTAVAMTAHQELPGVRLMGVPQGRTPLEWLYCLNGLLRLGIDTVGISKDYEVWNGGLAELVKLVPESSEIDIHLLGWGRQLGDLYDLANSGLKIRGVDSAKPLSYAIHGIRLPSDPQHICPTYPRRPYDFFKISEVDELTATMNCYVFKAWARGEPLIVKVEEDASTVS